MSAATNKRGQVLDLVKRLRQKPSTYNRELLDEAAATIAALLEELANTEGCDTCRYFYVGVNEEPRESCFRHSNWGWNEEEKVEAGEAPRWEADSADTVCSVCGFRCDDTYYLGAGRFCPECGAKMAEPLRPEWR